MATKSSAKKSAHRKPVKVKKAPYARSAASADKRRQDRIEIDIENAERAMAGLPPVSGGSRGTARPKPLRSRMASKIKGRKVRHYAARGAVHLLIGGGAVMFKHAPRGAARAGRWAGVRVKGRVVRQAQSRKWTTHMPAIMTDENGRRRIRTTTTVCLGCGEKHNSVQEMNTHYLTKHKDETPEPRTERKLPTIHKGATAKTAGKVIVKLHPEAKAGPARHRSNRRNPAKTNANQLVAKYGATVSQIGERTMSDGSAALIARGFHQWAEDVPGMGDKQSVLRIQEMMAGLERALHQASDTVNDVAREYKRLGVAPEVVNAPFANIQARLAEAAVQATFFLGNFNIEYAPEIAILKKRRAPLGVAS